MFKDLKLGFKMIKYGINKKGNITVMVIFLALGLLMLCVQAFGSEGGVTWLSGYYLTISGMYLGMMIISSTVSTLVQSSPYKLTLQVKVSSFATFLFTFAAFLIYLAVSSFMQAFIPGAYATPELIGLLTTQLVTTSLCCLILQVYMAIAYKAYWVSLIVVMVSIIPLMCITMNSSFTTWVSENVSLGTARLGGIACCVLGYVFARLLSGAMYKFTMSEASYKKALERDK